jgi:hypothetical protein
MIPRWRRVTGLDNIGAGAGKRVTGAEAGEPNIESVEIVESAPVAEKPGDPRDEDEAGGVLGTVSISGAESVEDERRIGSADAEHDGASGGSTVPSGATPCNGTGPDDPS